jgi:AdoMet-dependent heme synthase
MSWLDDSQALIDEFGATPDPSGCATGAGTHDDIACRLRKRLAYTSNYIEHGLMPEAYQAPLTLQFEVTYRCNLRCEMCYNGSGSSASRPKELTDDEWLRVAREGCENGILEAIISGGEPFLRPELVFRLLDLFKAYRVVPHLITNGWFITRDIARRLAEYRFGFVQVSIDGPSPAAHDAVRGVPGSWARATRALQLLASHGLTCRLAFTAVQSNYRSVPEVIDLAIALGARTVVMGKALAQGRGNANADGVLLQPDQVREFEDIYARARQARGTAIKVIIGMQSAHQLIEGHITPSVALVLRPNGDVRLGCLAPFSYGNVRDRSLAAIWRDGAHCGYRHPDVLAFTRDVLQHGELEAVRRLGLTLAHENRIIGFEEATC